MIYSNEFIISVFLYILHCNVKESSKKSCNQTNVNNLLIENLLFSTFFMVETLPIHSLKVFMKIENSKENKTMWKPLKLPVATQYKKKINLNLR